LNPFLKLPKIVRYEPDLSPHLFLRLWDQNDEEKLQVDDLESLHQLLRKTGLKNACKTGVNERPNSRTLNEGNG
jgi:hypothetical protein